MGWRRQGSAPLPAGSVVLELGCGDGKTLAGMPSRLENSGPGHVPRGLCVSVALPAQHADLILADACLLPFRKSSFDFVFAFHVTGHLLLPSREALAREVARVLVRGGKLFFREFGSRRYAIAAGRRGGERHIPARATASSLTTSPKERWRGSFATLSRSW